MKTRLSIIVATVKTLLIAVALVAATRAVVGPRVVLAQTPEVPCGNGYDVCDTWMSCDGPWCVLVYTYYPVNPLPAPGG